MWKMAHQTFTRCECSTFFVRRPCNQFSSSKEKSNLVIGRPRGWMIVPNSCETIHLIEQANDTSFLTPVFFFPFPLRALACPHYPEILANAAVVRTSSLTVFESASENTKPQKGDYNSPEWENSLSEYYINRGGLTETPCDYDSNPTFHVLRAWACPLVSVVSMTNSKYIESCDAELIILFWSRN